MMLSIGLLLVDQAPEIYGLIQGFTESDRTVELLRLTLAAPANCAGYVAQVSTGTRAVRLDAIEQLRQAGVEFGI